MQKNVAFKEEAQRLLQQAEQDSNNQLYSTLNAIIEQLAVTRNLSFVLNTDNNAVSFINKVTTEDLLPLVKDDFEIKETSIVRMKNEQNNIAGPIGVFDSGYGGLTILEAFRKELPSI